MNVSLWVGIIGAVVLIRWGIGRAGIFANFFDVQGVTVVLGGLVCAMLVNCRLTQLGSAFRSLLALFLPSDLPAPEDCVTEVTRLSRKAQKEGGVLSLQDESRAFAGGFLHRAIIVAIACGEIDETRRIVESEIRQVRVARQEDGNVFRTAGVLAPMFGLLGTLLGMVRVLETMADPTKASSAMALALSSAFLGIGLANFLCIPLAGQLRVAAMRETLILELLLEGVLDIASGKSPYVVELHLAAYSRRRREELETGAVAPAPEGVQA